MSASYKFPLKLVGCYAWFAALYWIVFSIAPGFHQRWFRGEDRIVEWLTFSGFLLAALIMGSTFRKCRASMGPWARAYVLGLAFFFFVCAGEELSWGQRIFGFATPDVVKAQNEQQEFNLHNLDFEHFHPIVVVSLFMKCFGVALPLLLLAFWRDGAPSWRRYVAPVALVPCFLFAELSVPTAKAVARRLEPRVGEVTAKVIKLDTAEMKEMYWGLSVMFATLAMHGAWRRKGVEGRVSSVPPSRGGSGEAGEGEST
ncbi:MAG TPA: hypothetical protein VIH35_04580 [Kiritimatiellia bacterium]|jgi:hypothetical protein